VKDADLIVVLSNGKIIEQGTHHSLMLIQGAYYGLYQAQIKPNVAEGGLLNY
jgi:ABC-type multidrug transport system fused ATPase/permease subunit